MLRNWLRRALMLAVLGISTFAVELAQAGPAMDVHREAVDVDQYPWSAIGKLYNETGAACTAVIISHNQVLTAAHCIFNFRTRQFILASSLHFLAGYRSGRYSVHARVASYQIGPGFDPLRYAATNDGDWAVLYLSETLPADMKPLQLSAGAAPSGTKAVIAGYPEDRAFAMTADADCELREAIDGGRLVLHTCRGVNGYSGAPILVNAGGKIEIAGIQIATFQSDGTQKMIAIPAQTVQQALMIDDFNRSTLFAINNMAGIYDSPNTIG
jgi:protease YdgD